MFSSNVKTSSVALKICAEEFFGLLNKSLHENCCLNLNIYILYNIYKKIQLLNMHNHAE